MNIYDPVILEFLNSLDAEFTKHVDFAILKLFIDPSQSELYDKYFHHISQHNESMMQDPFPNSGFDLFVPNDVIFDVGIQSKFIDHKIKSEMVSYHAESAFIENTAFTIHPRSSISKTPLMLANHTGIIDSGYRGSLIGAFRWLSDGKTPEYTVEKYSRLLQVCHPSLTRVLVCLVLDEKDLTTTVRGSGGFGSTGK